MALLFSSTFARLLQLSNALFPKSVTPLGILMKVRPVHPEKAFSPMLEAPAGIVISPFLYYNRCQADTAGESITADTCDSGRYAYRC